MYILLSMGGKIRTGKLLDLVKSIVMVGENIFGSYSGFDRDIVLKISKVDNLVSTQV